MISRSKLSAASRAGALAAILTLTLAAPAMAASASDAWITTKVKLSIATSEGFSAVDIHVDTVGRKVTLHGTVTTSDEKIAAEAAANTVKGVQAVRNLLQIVPAAHAEAIGEKDEAISAQVTAALAANPSLKGVSVQSVNKGVVLLQGKATTLTDHLTAVQVARHVPGVRKVASEIESPEALADASVWLEPNMPVGGTEPQTSTRGAARDLYITSMIKLRLLADTESPAMDINVDTRDGAVTLFGIVPSASSLAAAETEARKVKGVTSVKNQLEVVASTKQPAVEAKDDVVKASLAKNFAESANLGDVRTEVKNCAVRLTGTVPSAIERIEAMQIARATTGVCSVTDALTIQ